TSGVVTWMEERRRLFFGSSEVHTAQSQPITGTPIEVPVPRKVISVLVSIARRGGRLHTRSVAPLSVLLSVLKIENLALVDELTWELRSGLIGVTGQTGAGKSMIVGALKLILGERANHDLSRTGESLCSVEAIFELSSHLDQVNALLESS